MRAAAGIPLAAAPALSRAARRTALLRGLLAAALLVALATGVVAARGLGAAPGGVLPAKTSGVIVLDLSTSVRPETYGQIRSTLADVADTRQPYGLVVFSQSAYELTPPGTRAAELRPLLRFFTPQPPGKGAAGRATFRSEDDPRYLENPWSGVFRGGTRIGSGLELARSILRRDGVRRGGVLLISDLNDSAADAVRLTRVLVRYARENIPLRIVALSPSAQDRQYFERVLGDSHFVTPASVAPARRRPGPWTLVGVALGLSLLLALNEFAGRRLTWSVA